MLLKLGGTRFVDVQICFLLKHCGKARDGNLESKCHHSLLRIYRYVGDGDSSRLCVLRDRRAIFLIHSQ